MTDNKNVKTPSIFNTRDGVVRQRIAISAKDAEKIVAANGNVPVDLLISEDVAEGMSTPLLPEYTEVLPCLTIAIKEGDSWGRAALNINGKYADNFHGGHGIIGVTTDIINHPMFFNLQTEETGSSKDMTYAIKKEDAGLALQEFALSGARDFFKDMTGKDFMEGLEKRLVTNLGFQEVGSNSILRASVLVILTGDEFSNLMRDITENTKRLVKSKKTDSVKNYFALSVASITPYSISEEESLFFNSIIEQMNIELPSKSEEKEEVTVAM